MSTYRKSMIHLWAGWLRVSLVVGFVLALAFSAVAVAPAQAKPLYALGTYPNTSVVLGGNTNVTPSAAPTGTTSINVSTSTNFKGTFVADPSTGVVRVINAHPAGTYAVTVTAFGSSPATATFTLTVTNGVACTPAPGFSGTTNVNVGLGPASVAVGDFNNDGKQDFVAANYDFNHRLDPTRLWLGAASPARRLSAQEVGLHSVVVGDFNNDGKQDLATANYGSTHRLDPPRQWHGRLLRHDECQRGESSLLPSRWVISTTMASRTSRLRTWFNQRLDPPRQWLGRLLPARRMSAWGVCLFRRGGRFQQRWQAGLRGCELEFKQRLDPPRQWLGRLLRRANVSVGSSPIPSRWVISTTMASRTSRLQLWFKHRLDPPRQWRGGFSGTTNVSVGT